MGRTRNAGAGGEESKKFCMGERWRDGPRVGQDCGGYDNVR